MFGRVIPVLDGDISLYLPVKRANPRYIISENKIPTLWPACSWTLVQLSANGRSFQHRNGKKWPRLCSVPRGNGTAPKTDS